MKKVAIYCPFYITDDNNASWIESWITNVYKYEHEHDIFYSITYPTDPNKWDIVNGNHTINNSTNIARNISIDINATLLFNAPNVEHASALISAHKILKDKGYEYMIHIEQDVILYKPISNNLISLCEKSDAYMCISDTIPLANNVINDIDMSIFCINLNKIELRADLYDCLYADINSMVNSFYNKPIKPLYKSILEDYKNLLYTLFNTDNTYMLYQAYIQANPFNSVLFHIDNTNLVFFDMGRRLAVDNFRNNTLCIYKNNNSFIHVGQSRYRIS